MVVGMDGFRGSGICLLEHGMEVFRAFFGSQRLQPGAVCSAFRRAAPGNIRFTGFGRRIPFRRKGGLFTGAEIDIPQQSLDIEARPAGHYGDVAPRIDAGQALLAFLLEQGNAEFFPGIQDVYHMMGDTLHLGGCDFGGANVHMPVDLHGIRRDDFPAHGLGKGDGKLRLPYRCGAGKND